MPGLAFSRLLAAGAFAVALAPALLAQSPCFDTNFGANLNLGDDEVTAPLPLGFSFSYAGTAYTDISICANGYILLGSTNVATPNGDYSPSQAELLSGAPRICPMWNDFNPTIAGSGQIYFDASTPGVATVSWVRVYTYGTTTPSTFQVRFEASGALTLTYGAMGTVSTFQLNTAILGASPGLGSPANNVSLATRPLSIASDNFCEVITRSPGQPLPYADSKLLFAPTSPGYLVSDVACTPNIAVTTKVGAGCPTLQSPTLYEIFNVANPIDLNGQNLSFLPTGTDYIALPNLSPAWFGGYTNNLNALDESTHLLSLPFSFPFNGGIETSIYASSNGFVTVGGTDPGAQWWNGDVGLLLNGLPRIAGWWEDLDPSAAGAVYADTDPVTGEFVVTWANVPQWTFTSPNTFQIALAPSGMFTIRWNALNLDCCDIMTGYSLGNAAPDNGVQDLTAVNGATVPGTVLRPLALDAALGSAPQIGSTFAVEATDIAGLPNGVITLLLIGGELPGGIPLDALGLAGCTAFVQLPEQLSLLNLSLGSPSSSFALPIPNVPAFAGVTFMSQAVSDDTAANAFGFRVSNGLRFTIGL